MSSDSKKNQPSWRVGCLIIASLLLIHIQLVGWIACSTSPTLDEVGHLPSGLYTLNTGRFDVYRVNPPLVRTLSAIPVYFQDPKYDWSDYRNGLTVRPEWDMGIALVRSNGQSALGFFTLARLACIPITVLGLKQAWPRRFAA